MKGLAHKVVTFKPEAEIRQTFRALLEKAVSASTGSPADARAIITTMRGELEKEIRARARNKQEQITAARRGRIQHLLKMLKNMAKKQIRAVSRIRG